MFKKSLPSSFHWLILLFLSAIMSTTYEVDASTLREFTVPGGAAEITAGSDGNLWFTQGGFVGRLTPTGEYLGFEVPGRLQGALAWGITEGPDGALWITDVERDVIYRMTKTGQFTGYPLPARNSRPIAITVGPDRNLWFAEDEVGKVGRITPTGKIVEFPISAGLQLRDITTGPDGNLWITAFNTNRIFRLTPTGGVAEFPLTFVGTGATSIAVGPDGNLWFAHSISIGKISASGAVTEFPLPPNGVPGAIVRGPDGNMWYTDVSRHKIGQIKPNGAVVEFDPPEGTSPDHLAVGTDGNLWLSDTFPEEIIRFSPGGTPGPCVPGDAVLCIDDQPGDRRFKVEAEFSTTQAGGLSGAGHAVALANVGVDRGGLFWFFSQDNPEVFVKVLHGCEVNQKHWVFLSAGTNVGYIITVTDTATNVVRSYYNVDLKPAPVVQDTAAFSCAASP